MSERTKIGKSIIKTRHFWQDSARTHEELMSNVCITFQEFVNNNGQKRF